MADAPFKIEQVLVNPRWDWGLFAVDESRFIGLTLTHPVHGRITSILPRDIAAQMGAGLTALADGTFEQTAASSTTKQ